MLYYYEKRNIDDVDEVVDSHKTITRSYSLSDNYKNVLVSSYSYDMASYSKNGLYYYAEGVLVQDRMTLITKVGVEFLVHHDYDSDYYIARFTPEGMGHPYKFKVTEYYRTGQGLIVEAVGILYKASKAPGSLVSEFTSEEGMYPDDGIQGDFWYVKKSRVINFKYKDINGIVYDIAEAKYKDVNGNIVDIASAIYKDGSGNILS